MNKILIIGLQSLDNINKGYAYWSGSYFNDISYYSPLEELNTENTSSGMAYLTGRENFDTPAVNLKIDKISIKNGNFGIKYTPVDRSEFTSSKVKITLMEVLNEKFGNVMNVPFCAAIDKDAFSSAIDDIDLIIQIKKLKAKNKWNEILALISGYDDIEKNVILWNNKLLLDNIAFASAKMSECYVNIRRNFSNDADAQKFLKEKKKFRKLTLKLRQRCTELFPNQPGLYSNLGYSHYQFARELTMQGGRRDGNLMQEIKQSIEFIDKALSLDPNRITDLYRKGKIICDLLLSRMKFISDGKAPEGRTIGAFEEKYKNFRNCLGAGKECFKKVKDIYQNLPLIDEKSTERYFKEYIKSLYSLSSLNMKLISYKFSYVNLFGEKQICFTFEKDKELLIEASKYLKECCFKDNIEIKKYQCSHDLIFASKYNGAVDGVFKLYNIGRIYSLLYQIYFFSGKKFEAEEYFRYAEIYLKEAISYPFPKEKAMQSKNFIKEKLARIYIIHNEPGKAIELLKTIKGKVIDYYIRYTLAAAYYKAGEKENAITQITKATESPKFNKDMKTGELMLKIFRE